MDTRARRNSCGLFISIVPDQRFSTTCDESSSVQHVQPKGILQNPDFQQRRRGPFASTKHLVWTFFEIESPDSCRVVFCNMVCWGTSYQLCVPILDKTAETVAKCVAERWIQYVGLPMLIIADQGKEFVGTQFKDSRTQTASSFT